MTTYYERNLPHYFPAGGTFFVTFRLTNSLPYSVLNELKSHHELAFQKLSTIKNHEQRAVEIYKEQIRHFEKFDEYLDRCSHDSPMWLRNSDTAEVVKEKIHSLNGAIYDLITFTIMPNHVHMIITPKTIDTKTISLMRILQLLKSKTALECNKILKRKGAFWQYESYDHFVRNEEELNRLIMYTLNNPVKSGLCQNWEDWKWNYLKV